MNNLTPNQWRLLANILDLAADEFGNNGCNDYELPDTPENREFVTMIETQDLTPDEVEHHYNIYSYNGKITTGDTTIMRWFEDYARKMANNE